MAAQYYPDEGDQVAPNNPTEESKTRWKGIRKTLWPVLLLSRLLAVAPCWLGCTGPPKTVSATYNGFFITVSLVAQSFSVFTMITKTQHSRVLYFTQVSVFIFNRLYAAANFVTLHLYRSLAFSAYSRVTALDDEWGPVKSERSETILAYVQLSLMFACAAANPLIIQPDYFVGQNWFFNALWIWTNITLYLCISISLIQWAILVLNLAHHMDTLNEELTKFQPKPAHSTSTLGRNDFDRKNSWMFVLLQDDDQELLQEPDKNDEHTSQPPKTIATFRKFHRDIYKAVQELQTVYGGPITLGFCSLMVNSVLSLFEYKFELNVGGTVWLIYTAILICVVVMPSQMLLDKHEATMFFRASSKLSQIQRSMTDFNSGREWHITNLSSEGTANLQLYVTVSRQAQECADILHTAMQKDIHPDARHELLDFSIQLLDLPLRITPCNFFQLDHRKLVSVSGSILTYAIILRQIDGSDIKPLISIDSNVTNST